MLTPLAKTHRVENQEKASCTEGARSRLEEGVRALSEEYDPCTLRYISGVIW